MNELNSMYYIYKHYIDDKLFYIGKGINGRAFDFKSRNPDWLEITKNKLDRVRVEIVAYFKNEELAYEVERTLIIKYNLKGAKLTNYIYNEPHKDILKEAIIKTHVKPFVINNTFSFKHIIEINTSIQIWNAINNTGTPKESLIIFIDNNCRRLLSMKSKALFNGYSPLLIMPQHKYKHSISVNEKNNINNFVNTSKLPCNCDFLIIDICMIYDINLKLEDVDIVVINTVNVDIKNKIALNLSGDIDLLICKTNDEIKDEQKISLPEEYIDIPLNNERKIELYMRLNLIDKNGRIVKWPTIKKLLIKQGYKVEERTATIDGERYRISVITADDLV